MAPLSTTPAPFRMTGKRALDNSAAACEIALDPPGECSTSMTWGSSTSITWVQKSRGTLIWAGAEPRRAFSITRLSTSAMRVGSRTSSW